MANFTLFFWLSTIPLCTRACAHMHTPFSIHLFTLLPTCFFKSRPKASRCVVCLYPAPLAEAPGQVARPFSQRAWSVFSLRAVQCPAGGILPRNVFASGPWGPEMRAPLGHQSQALRGCPLWGLSVPTSFSRATGECEAGHACRL